MNVLLLQRWLREEAPALIGSRLRAAAQLDPKSLLLDLRGEDGPHLLLISVREDCPTLALLAVGSPLVGTSPQAVTSDRPTEEIEPSGFVKAIGYQLSGYTLIGIEQHGFDRSVVLRFYLKDGYGKETHKQLRVELAGRASNAYLLSERGMVVSMFKRVRAGTNRVRLVQTGRPLPPPPPLGKFIAAEQNAAALGEELAQLASAEGMAGDGALRELLTRRIAGGEVKLWPALEPLLPVTHDLDTLLRFISELQSGEFTGQLFGLHEPGDANRVALEQWRAAAVGAHRSVPGASQTAAKPAGRGPAATQDHTRALLEAQLALAERADELEALGLDLMARAAALDSTGAAQVSLTQWQSEHPDWAQQVDPLASAADSAQRLVNYAQRLRRGKTKLETKLKDLSSGGHRAADRVSSGAGDTAARAGAGTRPSQELSAKLEKRGVKHLRFTSSDGLTILCGLSDASNDGLLKQFGNARHLWLHARDFTGSHVIILSNGVDVPRRTLEEAATVAAFHSKAQREHEVEVSYVPMKHVRKPKGAKPGLVFISNEKVISVRPERFEEMRLNLLRSV